MAGTDHDRLRLDRRNALKAVTLSAAALAAGAGVTDVLAAATPTPPSDPHAGPTPQPRGARPATGTLPAVGVTYQQFAGTDFDARQSSPVTFNPYTGAPSRPVPTTTS